MSYIFSFPYITSLKKHECKKVWMDCMPFSILILLVNFAAYYKKYIRRPFDAL